MAAVRRAQADREGRVGQHFYGVAPTVGATIIVGFVETPLPRPAVAYMAPMELHAVAVASIWRQLLKPYAGTNYPLIAGMPVLAALVLL